MKIIVTGASGFIGKNMTVHLDEREYEVLPVTRETSETALDAALKAADFIFHLAGINRPTDPKEFTTGNVGLTQRITDNLTEQGKSTPIVFSSSIQAAQDNPYGRSKLEAETVLRDYALRQNASVWIYRLPNVFGKWCRPNYNSFVATFCNNIAQDKDIQVNDPNAKVRLVYIDDVCRNFLSCLDGAPPSPNLQTDPQIDPIYETTVGEVAAQIKGFKDSRDTLITARVGTGLTRALYSTYLTYLTPEQFSYTVPVYGDERGVFSEMLKTEDSGQFSFFTAHPGITRGLHYHHTKTEKFLVLKGQALFRFKHIISGEKHELSTDGDKPQIVETVPGWTHDITNVGETEMICMLWANEIFDRENPDTKSMSTH